MADDPNSTWLRSLLLSDILARRADIERRKLIEGFANRLDYKPIENMMISTFAWNRVAAMKAPPELAFAHPIILW